MGPFFGRVLYCRRREGLRAEEEKRKEGIGTANDVRDIKSNEGEKERIKGMRKEEIISINDQSIYLRSIKSNRREKRRLEIKGEKERR